MPIAERPEDIPEGAVDVTKDVNDLKDQLHQLFSGRDVMVIGMALGALIGETLEDQEAVNGLLSMIADMAATVHVATHMTVPEGVTVQ